MASKNSAPQPSKLKLPTDSVPLPDPQFWSAHAAWKAKVDEWEHSADRSDEAFRRHAAEVYDAFSAMWLTPIRTAYALSAKLKSCNFQEAELPDPAGTTTKMLQWDLNRMIALELAVPGPSGYGDDKAVFAAWDRRKAAYDGLCALGDEGNEAEENHLYGEISAAEEELSACTASTTRGAAAQIWAGIFEAIFSSEDKVSQALWERDAEYLRSLGDRLDPSARMIVAGLRSLELMAQPREAIASLGDMEFREAWQKRCDAYRTLYEISASQLTDDKEIPQERKAWDAIKQAEVVIAETPATTPAGIEAKLWISIEAPLDAQENKAVMFGDLDALESIWDRLDAETRTILSAIRDLRTMGRC